MLYTLMGDHTYEGVLNDITSWKDKVKNEGLLLVMIMNYLVV